MALGILIILCFITLLSLVFGIFPLMMLTGIGSLFFMKGFYVNGPNEVAVHSLFGKYYGTDNTPGFRYNNPFLNTTKVSSVVHNLETNTIKVNDLSGNPIELSGVIVWRIKDAASACFSVSNVKTFIEIQSETTLREIAMKFPYDTNEEGVISLRGSSDEIIDELIKNLKDRVQHVGLEIVDARFNKLSYAQEIAQAMLQRQQAQATIDARKLIVQGAVTMVDDALSQLEALNKVKFNEEQKAQLASNLLIVLTSDKGATPTVSL